MASQDTVTRTIADFFSRHPYLTEQERYAVAVSGGPDSMALLNSLIAVANRTDINAITVDHGLRAEAGQEAEVVAGWVKNLGKQNVTHITLQWEGEKPQTGLMEEARVNRYRLLANYCREQNIKNIFVAHHQDDQAETFLMRLIKGSGLDGLSGMTALSDYNENLQIVRPLLKVAKQDLVTYCQENNIPFIQDPTNRDDNYLRTRLRRILPLLEEEGLSTKRLSVTAGRIARARQALEEIAQRLYQETVQKKDDKKLKINFAKLRESPEEIGFRVIYAALHEMRPDSGYNIRMEKFEDLFEEIWFRPEEFKPRTLGGFIFTLKEGSAALYIEQEK
jgi:tRNA(Ile)-lysidine synthase